MHSFRIAEWLLALVTTRDRAAATVGDLAEGAATRGGVWFWSGVLRTAASLMWRDIAEHPARITGLALLGVYTGMLLLFGFLDGIVFFTAAYLSGKELPLDFTGWKIWLAAPVLFGSLLVGRTLARWGPGRELAACVIFAILAALCNLVPMLRYIVGSDPWWGVLIVPVAAAGGRARRLRATQPDPYKAELLFDQPGKPRASITGRRAECPFLINEMFVN
jgi:hypothetical protein